MLSLHLGSKNISYAADSPLAGKLFVVIGAGGAGKALAYGAKEKGARVVIANRTYGKVPALDCFLQCSVGTRGFFHCY
jgi:3-dehydroquinate dehydratase/shikimate dehydrogenase